MRTIHFTALAAATLLSASVFAQSTNMDAGTPVQSQDMSTTQQMNDVNNANVNARAPAATTGSSYNSSMPADRATSGMADSTGMSGSSSTGGSYASGSGQYGNQPMGAANDRLNGSGHYADSARGSQFNANDVHATPQPGALNNQIFRGN